MQKENAKHILNPANGMTMLRMVGTGCLLFLRPASVGFYGVYTVTGLTDMLDGWIARKTGTAGEFGARLDSISDLLFYAVMLLRVFPILWQTLPGSLWYGVAAVLLLRACAYLTAAIRFRRFASLHTYLNKATGGAVFLIPYLLHTPYLVPFCWVVCGLGLPRPPKNWRCICPPVPTARTPKPFSIRSAVCHDSSIIKKRYEYID